MSRSVGLMEAAGVVALTLSSTSCQPTAARAAPRYIVTASPIDIGIGKSRFCIAIDPNNPKGVWWWEPGQDCSTRTTGPRVFEAEDARVIPSQPAGTIDVSFRLQLHGPPAATSPAFADIRLILQERRLRALTTGAEVLTTDRRDLDVPAFWRQN